MGSQVEAELGSPYVMLYEEYLSLDAGVTPQDSPEQVRRKMQAFWDSQVSKDWCQLAGFRGGNLMKWAINRDDWYFLHLAIDVWGLNLNHVDIQGMTELDYARYEIDKHNDDPPYLGVEYKRGRMLKLQRYYDHLRKGGGKHRSELP
jgi:hypothetical protein